jgi:pyridoxine 5-phosphate synthase
MANTPEILRIALDLRPDIVCLVPERRLEVTTEGGLDVAGRLDEVRAAAARLRDAGIRVSLFLDADPAQLEAAQATDAEAIELHTGQYALAPEGPARDAELKKLADAALQIRRQGWALHAGHGLNYLNVGPLARMQDMAELNIGHAIVSRAVLVGMERAVREMKALL